MSAILVPTLYVLSGVCAYTALHHGLAVMRQRVSLTHLLFALVSLLVAAHILAKAAAYSTETAEALVAMRRLEVSLALMLFSIFPWFVAEFTGIRRPRILIGLGLFFASVIAVNLALPYGVQFVELPRLLYFELPWGERVVDLRVHQRGTWHIVGWLAILAMMAFSFHMAIALYRHRDKRRGRALLWALGLFFGAVLFNVVVNLELIEFIHLSEFGFVALVVLMDQEMMLERRDQTRRIRSVLDHLPAAICLKDLRGRFQLVNQGFENAFQTSETNIIDKTELPQLPLKIAEEIRSDETLAIQTGQKIENEYVLEQRGEQHIYQVHHFPLLRPDGRPYAVCGVYIDVTESRHKDVSLNKFRRQVWHTDRVASTGAITGSLAHELCQPLAAILNNAQAGLRFLAQDKVDLEEIRELLGDIVRDDKRAGAVINGLRAMLQQQETPYADIDLALCIEEVFELLHSEFVRHGVDVEHNLQRDLTLRANKIQIQQVLINLLINALEAMDAQPAGQRLLQISAVRADDGNARVSVRDTGIGIAQDVMGRIFDGFYTTKPQGLGVGLEVCRSILESHRGYIRVEANPDRGVTFHFSLPLSGEPTPTAGPTDN